MSRVNSTLVLTATYSPIKVVPWHEAFSQVLKKSAHLVTEYDGNRIRAGLNSFIGSESAPSHTTGIEALRTFDDSGLVIWKRPSVIREAGAYKRKRIVRFSRENVWLRDEGKCAYCDCTVSRHTFTYDHVIPKSRGGKTNFANIVVCCLPCNQKKGHRTPNEAGMKLIQAPVTPKNLSGIFRPTIKLAGNIPEDWKFWLADSADVYWNTEIPEEK